MTRPARVLLVSMPLSAPHYPSMGLSLLKPALEGAGLACEIRYFSLDYVDRLGADAHDCLTDPRYYMAHVGEWVFAAAAHDGAPADDGLAFFTEYFQKAYAEHYTPARLMTFLAAREGASDFIEHCLDEVDGTAYAMVGFSSAFQQNMASLALARRLKERYPHLTIVLGGTNCQGDMGVELHCRYPFLDAVCLGEGDLVFPEFVRRTLAGEDCAGMAGMAVRKAGECVVPGRMTVPVEDMDALPYPDFTEFFAQHRHSPVAAEFYPPAAVFETSRGCWWGAKHHCTFCGLNALTLAYRSKSQARAYDELAYLAGRYGNDLANADLILDPHYFEEFIPRLAEEGPEVTIYYEMKANLKPEQLVLLSRAGIKKIQPGLESLDTEILKLIDKGCSLLQNVQTLKLAAECGIYVEWLALYGLPGETPEQYRRMASIIPKLRHLQPPSGFIPARADRFSPYFYRPEAYGISLEPAPVYRFIYPFEEASLRRLAYHFDMRSPALDGVAEYTAPAAKEYRLWQERKDKSALAAYESDEGIRVSDRRAGRAERTWHLKDAEAAILSLAWKIAPRHAIDKTVAARFGDQATQAALKRLLARGLLLQEGEQYLALPLRQPGFCRAPSWEEIRAGLTTPYMLRDAPPRRRPV
ncbi:MAG: RiPP maturation radical SAM C-methyltransferase, partial [Alphaproteobacteria bacterium]